MRCPVCGSLPEHERLNGGPDGEYGLDAYLQEFGGSVSIPKARKLGGKRLTGNMSYKPTSMNPYLSELVKALERAARQLGYRLVK